MSDVDLQLFTRTPTGVTAALPAQLADLFGALERREDGEHPLADGHTGPLAVVPHADTDPLAALEAELAADGVTAAHAELVTAQRSVVARLAATPADGTGLVRAALDAEEAAALLAWLNRSYLRLRTAEVGELAIGGEQSAFGMLGFDDEPDGTAEVPFSLPAAMFAQLTGELLAALR